MGHRGDSMWVTHRESRQRGGPGHRAVAAARGSTWEAGAHLPGTKGTHTHSCPWLPVIGSGGCPPLAQAAVHTMGALAAKHLWHLPDARDVRVDLSMWERKK